ncbi:hypothetical protein LguiB_007758 [Lonicera macranthoides]
MNSSAEDSVREELGLLCNREIQIQQQKLDTETALFQKSLQSAKAKAKETLRNQENLRKAKTQQRGVEDDLVKALAVKTRKEAKWMATVDSISATKARVQELKRIVEDRKARIDEHAALIYQQNEAMVAYEEKSYKDTGCREEIEEAISWYSRVLGFRIERGHGVKFIFTNISLKNPKEEYSFMIRHENDTYTLLDCDPHLNDTKELIHELNRTNGLFKFVRIVREKFQKAAACGTVPQVTLLDQVTSTISMSAPVSSVSTDSRSQSPAKQENLQSRETNRISRKVNRVGGGIPAIRSPGSASSLRRSPRFKVKK